MQVAVRSAKKGSGLRTHRRLRSCQADPQADAGAQRREHLLPCASTCIESAATNLTLLSSA